MHKCWRNYTLHPVAVVFVAIFCNMSISPALLLTFDCLSHFDMFPSTKSVSSVPSAFRSTSPDFFIPPGPIPGARSPGGADARG